MPCPAFCCGSDGTVLIHNSAAEKIWSGPPSQTPGRWSGFATLRHPDGSLVHPADGPVARAATGAPTPPTELLASSTDEEPRRVVFHARPIFRLDGCVVGAMCALTDVSERRRLEDEAEASNASREVFLSVLAHELRNPLAPIMSAAGAMRMVSDDPAITRMADVVERQTKQLARFIADLLHAARLEAPGDAPIQMRDCNVADVVDQAADVVASALQVKSQTLIVIAANRSAPLRCDTARLAQALGNALLNASAYSAEGAQIRFSATAGHGLFEATISDKGIGVDPSRLDEILEPFKRFADAPGQARPAAGLGLSIAKSVAEAHGGMVLARSLGPGSGTTVVFALPIAKI